MMGDSNNRMSNENYPGNYNTLSTQPYKYNGKELDRMHGLDGYDNGECHYDAVLGRWMCMDPKSEKYYRVSPYAYCRNNPIKYIAPDGREVVISGALSDEALRQLQERMNNRITLTRDGESGRVSYTVNEGQKLKGDAKRMAGMIDNQSITVNLATTDRNETSTGNLIAALLIGCYQSSKENQTGR